MGTASRKILQPHRLAFEMSAEELGKESELTLGYGKMLRLPTWRHMSIRGGSAAANANEFSAPGAVSAGDPIALAEGLGRSEAQRHLRETRLWNMNVGLREWIWIRTVFIFTRWVSLGSNSVCPIRASSS